MSHRPLPRRLLAACLLLLLLHAAPLLAREAGPIHQLRVYEIFDGTRQAFHDRFRDHAARIMARHGFHIVSIWESRAEDGTPRFVYLLQWPDEATMRTRWAAFMADEEWSRIKRETGREHGRFVGGIEEHVLLPTDYSPQAAFRRD
ncbi:NIPSNAP family protein [Luteimonas kalidii]|uniref:NIPSNAP family protein n=1 Tax=Luteimonas kalidii TaxID=3042025 RepID=A0ABT6JUE9_9GAMM|nr:NIPSNAP family protein [Luteimonas kalidii]MDH5834102.1 NIPSNAP family protein [Luteimonas kalidii]